MLLTTILNHCQRFAGFVMEKASLCRKNNSIDVDVRARANSKPICSSCDKPGSTYDHLAARRFQHVPIYNMKVTFVYRMRRVDCKNCGVTVEAVPWGNGKRRMTNTFMLFLGHWAKLLSWKQTAKCFGVCPDTVFMAVEWVVQWGLKHRVLGSIRAIGVDEIQCWLGHKYVTLVYQIETGATRLLWVGKDRTEKTFEQFFDMIGKPIADGIEFVCSDMWKPYLNVIRNRCSNALNVLDRFHIVKHLNEALNEVRAGEARQMAKDGYEPVLKKTRFCLLARKKNLTNKQRFRLRDLLRYNLKTVRAYLLKESFQEHFWNYVSPTWAGKYLDAWCGEVMRSRIEPMKKVAKMLRNHRELILNYFRAKKQFSSGIVEGMNNKAKVRMRQAYGYRTFRALEVALYHVLGNLPEPQLPHPYW